MNWIDCKINMPPLGERILIFSPVYPEGDPDRFRIVDSMFLVVIAEATHWATLEAPSDED